jgi:hypothetical protein
LSFMAFGLGQSREAEAAPAVVVPTQSVALEVAAWTI